MTDVLEGSRQLWDSHARRDPLWAILSDPSKKGGRWDLTRFFQTGVGEISFLFYQLHSRGIAVKRGRALDFGCGVGRLTQALAPQFDEVVGVDVSPRMIELATRLNRFPLRARYAWNQRADLTAWNDGAFDFIVSNIVLQHIPPDITLQYLREFHRVLAPGGALVFQLPSHERGPGDGPPVQQMRAMPDDAYQAALGVTGIPSGPVRPGSEIMLDVEVTNLSVFQWSAQDFGVIRIGNHWVDAADGRMLRRDDGRTSLPGTLPPRDSCRAPLAMIAPSEEGEYQCEIDLCHEGVVWFGEKGSPVLRFPVRVGRRDAAGSGQPGDARASQARTTEPAETFDTSPVEMLPPGGEDGDAADPEPFPMYGVHKDAVIEFVAAQGGELILVERDPSCGEDWVSYRYYVRNRT